jgi:YegS/Rv2252/BmrU family lipid kinase
MPLTGQQSVVNVKRCVAVANPHGGRGQGAEVLAQVKPIFVAAGVEFHEHLTEHSGHALELARSLDLTGFDALCVIGGDGTVHEVVNGLFQREDQVLIPLGLIPAGTGNTLHHHVGCSEPIQAANCILRGATSALDVARVTMGDQLAWCVDIIGYGAVVDINRTAEKLRMLGPVRYATAALWHILRPVRRRARLVLDGEAVDDEFQFIIACNPKSTGAGMLMAPHAEIDDGKLDVVVIRRCSRLQMLRLFRRVFDGSHLSLPCVEYRQVRSFAITPQANEPLNLDGEITGMTPFTAEVLPGALRVFTPDAE